MKLSFLFMHTKKNLHSVSCLKPRNFLKVYYSHMCDVSNRHCKYKKLFSYHRLLRGFFAFVSTFLWSAVSSRTKCLHHLGKFGVCIPVAKHQNKWSARSSGAQWMQTRQSLVGSVFISCSYPMTCVTPPARLLPPEYRP